MVIFSPHEMKYIWYFPKKVNFLFLFTQRIYRKHNLTFFLGRFSFDLAFAVCLLSTTLSVNIVFYLENGLESYFNE